MHELMWPLIAFIIGLPAASAWTMLVYAVHEQRPRRAAFWDAVVIGLGSVATLTIWSASGDDWKVLVAWMVAGALGTYINVKRKRDAVARDE